MTQNVANPFFGNPTAGSFATRATLPRNQLLRPFPQFDTVNMSETNYGKSQYHAGVIQVKKRMTWWSGSFSYTYSRLWDNQFGQGNYYTSAPGLLNNYTFIEGTDYFNPDAEYERSLLDSPHKVAMTPTVQAAVRRRPPVLQQQPRRQRDSRQLDDLGGDPDAERLPDRRQPEHQHQHLHARRQPAAEHRARARNSWSAAASPIGCATIRTDDQYLNQAAFVDAPAGTFGNSPRTLPGAYSPWRNSTDVAINKDIRFGGGRRASLQLQIINLFDNPWYAAMQSVASGNTNFGRVASQGNYSRTMQITGRFSF